MQRSRARAHGDTVAASHIRSKGFFKAHHSRAENELAAFDDVGYRLLQVVSQGLVEGSQI